MSDTENFPRIPGYTIEKKLGRGGMADVYLGIQEALDRKVAIKILNPDMIKNPQLLQRFLNEARTASRLAHPNIVTIHDVAQIDHTCYIVMEYLQESLVDRIKFSPDRKIEPKEALRILEQVAHALTYAHDQGFIHRDIKPDNILFRKDNTPVLVDFGIARTVESDNRLTTDGMIIGTPHYMSPEQCRGEETDAQSDIYSLGIVFYEMLTGGIPYKANSAAGILVKHIQAPIPQLSGPLTKYQPLVDKMMKKEKSERVRGGLELLRLLRHYSSESSLDTIEVSKPEEWVFQGLREKAQPTHRLTDSDAGEKPTMLSPYKKRKKTRALVWTLLVLLVVGGGAAGYYFLSYLPAREKEQAALHEQEQKHITVQEPEIITGTEGKTGGEQPGDISGPQQQTNPDAETLKNREYEKFFSMAEEYFKDGQVEKAREKLNQAKAVKETDEVKALQKQIDDYLEEEKKKEYNKYVETAKDFYKKGNLAGARKNIALARKVMGGSTDELDSLARDIRQKEEAVRRERLRRKRDDDAFARAKSSNTIYAYEKYLEKYPSGDHAAEAQKRLDELKSAAQLEIKIKDDVAFETAAGAGTIAAYEAYLKEYSYGAHAAEARARINSLKEKIIKETRIKIELVRVDFFESGARADALGQRKYSTRFSKQGTRYIYTEIKYKNKLYGIAAGDTTVVLEYNHGGGVFKQQLKGIINSLQEAKDGIYWRGVGWTEAGKWLVGTYTVTVYFDNKEAGKAHFEIY
jgi:serine/threonine protein kinase